MQPPHLHKFRSNYILNGLLLLTAQHNYFCAPFLHPRKARPCVLWATMQSNKKSVLVLEHIIVILPLPRIARLPLSTAVTFLMAIKAERQRRLPVRKKNRTIFLPIPFIFFRFITFQPWQVMFESYKWQRAIEQSNTFRVFSTSLKSFDTSE